MKPQDILFGKVKGRSTSERAFELDDIDVQQLELDRGHFNGIEGFSGGVFWFAKTPQLPKSWLKTNEWGDAQRLHRYFSNLIYETLGEIEDQSAESDLLEITKPLTEANAPDSWRLQQTMVAIELLSDKQGRWRLYEGISDDRLLWVTPDACLLGQIEL